MKTVLSLAALMAGLWLLYLGYARQQSLAGRADSSFSRLGRTIDGADHTTTHVKYYVAGTVLLVVGAFGVGIVKK